MYPQNWREARSQLLVTSADSACPYLTSTHLRLLNGAARPLGGLGVHTPLPVLLRLPCVGEHFHLPGEISLVLLRTSPQAVKKWEEGSAMCLAPVKQALIRRAPVAELNGRHS